MDTNILKQDTVYVLNKNEGVVAVFNKTDKDTLIDPLIREVQNQEAEFHFQIPASSKKWKDTYNPENLYLVDNKVFSANFSDSIERDRDENGKDIITVKAYERQKLLEREFAKIYNSTTGFEEIDDLGNPVPNGKIYIDEFMVIILSNGDKDLLNGEHIVPTTFEKGTSGYALQALLYGTGWTVGTCDVEGTFDLELDQENIYDMVKKVQEIWGGILVIDSLNKVIHHRDETKYLPYSGYEVKYQKNIQSNKYIGDNKIITQLCPLGEGSLNIKSVNDGSVWLTNHEYTDSVLKSIENNDSIYVPEQLKRWGERKLKELCKPRRELKVTAALLKAVKGHEHEKVGLNDIVDVIDYEFIEEKTTQLRVIEYEHYVWNDADAVLEIGDITLDSTDIFKKAVGATNLINNGTLDTSKVIDYYKNGQSLRETLREVDRTIIQTKSEFSKSDDEIRASVEQIVTDVDTLNNDVVSQSKTLADLQISVGKISSKVETIAGLTETITGHTGRVVLDEAIEGYLLGLSIHGYDGAFQGTVLSDDTILSDDLELLDPEIKFNVYTKNKCPTSEENYEQGYITQNTLENLKYKLKSVQLNAFFAVDGGKNINKVHYSDENWNYYCSIQPSSNSRYFYYLNIKPNTKYLLDLNIDQITDDVYNYWGVGTYTKDWIEKAQQDNWEKFTLNNAITNAYYNNEWIYDKSVTKFEIQTGPKDEHLILSMSILNWYDTITIYEITEQNYLKTIEPFEVVPNSEMYFSLDNSNYRFVNLYFYDENKNYLTDWNTLYPDNKINSLTEKNIIIPENAYFMEYVITKNTEIVLEENEEEKTFVITPKSIEQIKPQLEYGTLKTDFIKYNTQKLEFNLDDELRVAEDENGNEVYDEFTIIEKNAQLIKRIGVDSEGNNYILTNPEYISYGTVEIPIVEGQNIIEVVDYTPTIIAEYVKQNVYTEVFATKVEVSTVIEQTDSKILLAASKKISKDELIQEFNSQIAITPEKILIEGDKISIRSSYFTLTDEGEITATKGTIAGWIIDDHQIYKDMDGYRTALYDGSSGENYDATSFYAGLPVGETNLHKAGFRIRSSGALNLKYIHVLNESGGLRIWYDVSERADGANQVCMDFTRCGFWNYLANGNYWSYLGINYTDNIEYGYGIFINDAQNFNIVDDLHDKTLANFKRIGNNGEASEILFWATTYVNGYQVATQSSDERLKTNIMDSTSNALSIIKQILHRRFDWIKDGTHISIGYIAQELIKIDPNFVIYNKEFDTYQIDLLYILATATKAIQEEDEKVEKLTSRISELEKQNEKKDKIIKLLADKLGCTDEIEKILNE